MNQKTLEPDEIEEETHIVHERIIEEPNDQQQERNGNLLEKYIIKGAAFTFGAVLLLLTGTGLAALIFGGGFISTVVGIVIALLAFIAIIELIEE